MADWIKPEAKTIGEYFKDVIVDKDFHFEIPTYQRAYSWSIPQCEQLLDDINAFIDNANNNNKRYFFGTIILDCSNDTKQNGEKVYSLVDGQQRTTTFLLLIKALLLRIQKLIEKLKSTNEQAEELIKEDLTDKKKFIFSILYNAKNSQAIYDIENDWKTAKDRIVIENNSINELYKDELKTILNCKDYERIAKEVHQTPKKQGDNRFTNFYKNFKYFYEQLKNKDSTEIIKFANNLLGKCEIIEIRSLDTDEAITMFNSLNSAGMPLNTADIISAKLFAKSNNDEEFENAWAELKKLSSELGVVDLDAILQEFMHFNLAKNNESNVKLIAVRTYFEDYIKKGDQPPLTICNDLLKIAKLWDYLKDFVIVKVLLKFNVNFKYFFISYFYARYDLNDKDEFNIPSNEIMEFSEAILKLFIILEVCPNASYSTKDFKMWLFDEHKKIANKNVSLNEIKSDFEKQSAELSIKYELEKSIVECKKHSIVFLSEYLYCKENNELKNFDFDLEKVNVEHIASASGRNLVTIRKDAGLESQEDFEDYVNRVGNKILLDENINKSIGNDWFRTKKEKYKDSKRVGLVKKIADYNKTVWTKEDIDEMTREHTIRIVDFVTSKKQ